jgi:hypothetical protein
MSELNRRAFLRLGLGLGLSGLVAFEVRDALTGAGEQPADTGPGQAGAERLSLQYLGSVQLADAPDAPVHYHVYQTTSLATNQEHGALYFLSTGPAEVAPRALPGALHPDAPGQLTLQIQPFDAADQRYQRRLPDGRVVMNGASLGTLRALFGGDRGVVTDPALGQAHQIDLTPWANAHPDQTYLNIAFYFRPAEGRSRPGLASAGA